MRLLVPGTAALACAIALGWAVPQVAAQQYEVTLTPADKAAYQEFLKVCAQPLAAMKKLMASHGETATDAQIRELFITIPPILRDQAKEDKIPLVSRLREARAGMKKEADDPKSTDPSNKVIAPPMLCWLDLLIANETGGPKPSGTPSSPSAPSTRPSPSTSSPSTRAPRPPSPAAPAAPAVIDPYASLPVDCVRIADTPEGSYGAFQNVCDYPVNFSFCAYEPNPGAWSEYFKCQADGSKLGFDGIAARGRQAAHIKGAKSVHWFACRKPKEPKVTFNGKELVGSCK